MRAVPANCDVVVIGGGPAGSTAANLLAQKGHDVVLLEKAKHPRPVVGESILPHMWKYADMLGATEDIERANFIRKAGGTGIWTETITQLKLADFGYTRPALHVERDVFDNILLRVAERKGVRVFEKMAVREVRVDDPGITVSCVDLETGEGTEVSAAYVVDGSGQAAVIARQMGFREFDKDLRFMSAWGYYRNSRYIAEGGVIQPFEKRREIRPTTMQLGIGDWGWCWHIVLKESTSVGLVLAQSQLADFKEGGSTLEERFHAMCTRLPVLSGLLRDATLIEGSVEAIKDFAYHPTTLAGPGWFLAGDAAAFVDPVNSAGVLAAFFSGMAAANAVHNSLLRPASAAYQREVFSTMLRQRLALFRIAALPPGHDSYPEDIHEAVKAARFDSGVEQELLVAQAQLTNRPNNLDAIQRLDPRLNYTVSNNVRELSNLVNSEYPFALHSVDHE